MSEAQKILKMIEVVDPADTNTLDEIDARVWCWLNGFNYKYTSPAQWLISNDNFRYTRSRDALKAIRPEGWDVIVSNPSTKLWVWQLACGDKSGVYEKCTNNKELPTEELAELHAIIQAIQWERDNARKS